MISIELACGPFPPSARCREHDKELGLRCRGSFIGCGTRFGHACVSAQIFLNCCRIFTHSEILGSTGHFDKMTLTRSLCWRSC